MGIAFGALSLVSLSVWGATYKYRLWVRFANGYVYEISHGRTSIHIWDTKLYRIDYPPGFTFGENHENEWHFMPTFHFNTPSVNRGPGHGQWLVAIPLWMFSAGFAGAALLARRASRRRPGWQCHACSYDLRGLQHDRCPECGVALVNTASASILGPKA